MKWVIDSIMGILFWTFTVFSVVEVYDFFQKGAIQNIDRGLSSTEKFSEVLIKK